MPKADYLFQNDDAFAAQLQNFKTNIGSYSATLGLSAAQTGAHAADADYFAYLIACQEIAQNVAQQWTSWKKMERIGGTPPASGAPVAPVFPAAVAAVAPGIEPRFRALVKLIKGNPAYNEAMGEVLGIEGAQKKRPDLATIRPDIDALVGGGRVEIDWGWGGHFSYLDMVRIEVDRGDGKGFVLLATDTTPGYIDNAALPLIPAIWTYRAIYMVDDQQVGQWSKPVSVPVGG